MKKTTIFLGFIALLFSCDVLNEASNLVNNSSNSSNNKPSLTNDEVIAGLREALQLGIKNSVSLTSVTDGFLKNNEIRLPFPPDAQKVRDKALEWKLDGQVEKFETTLNRAAEEASKEALPIFADAIKNMSVQDGFAILNGGDGAATKFLKDNTSSKLVAAFSPKVKEATSRVKLTEYWNPIITKYNNAMTLTGGQKLNPDLDAYITQKAIDGLFLMVSKEENKIRKDPAAQVTALLSKVFGSLLK
ncbi:MAG: DUF4197 domain-containing protein [Bacteroidetes bacterium]|jgi:hypothetical protein|nr:DUF4197 domain-containing protein [Bacteroidota bacterium]